MNIEKRRPSRETKILFVDSDMINLVILQICNGRLIWVEGHVYLGLLISCSGGCGHLTTLE